MLSKPQKPRVSGVFLCIGRENKPPAMQVCPQIALASSKTPVSINI